LLQGKNTKSESGLLQAPLDKQKTTCRQNVFCQQMVFDLAKALTIDKMHRSNQIVKICTSFAHPSFGRIQFQKATHTDYGKLKPHPN